MLIEREDRAPLEKCQAQRCCCESRSAILNELEKSVGTSCQRQFWASSQPALRPQAAASQQHQASVWRSVPEIEPAPETALAQLWQRAAAQ